jgi:hypothetical protein
MKKDSAPLAKSRCTPCQGGVLPLESKAIEKKLLQLNKVEGKIT